MFPFFNDKTATFSVIAKTFYGLEEVLAKELFALGAKDIEVLNRSVIFDGDLSLLYRANLHLRTALRLIVPFYTFRIRNEQDIYDELVALPWHEQLTDEQTFAIDIVSSSPLIKNSHYAMHLAKDAIADQIRRQRETRPSVDTKNPTLRINLHIFKNECTLSLDSTGESLHKRGYRLESNEAPMNEVLAAGLIMLSGWQRDSHFVDAMCGSGTILIEAAMYAHRIAPANARLDFDFMQWPNFDQALWDKTKEESENEELDEFEHYILGSDISERNIQISRQNLKRAGLLGKVSLMCQDIADFEPPQGEPGVCVMNPPYGERMHTSSVENLFRTLGDRFKKYFQGYTVWLISSDELAFKSIGLKPKQKIPLFNGALECRFQSYELYEGKFLKPESPKEEEEETQ